jgi:hypothetical protein
MNHNTLLHPVTKTKQSRDNSPVECSSEQIQPASVSISNHVTTLSSKVGSGLVKTSTVLLGTIQCQVLDSFNRVHTVRAVLDSGSQISIMTKTCACRLGFKPTPSSCDIVGISNSVSKSLGNIDCTLLSRLDGKTSLRVKHL